MSIPQELGVWFHNHTFPDGERTIPLDLPMPAWGYDNPKVLTEHISNMVKFGGHGHSLLDIACNGGYMAAHFASRFFDVTAIDYDTTYTKQSEYALKRLGLSAKIQHRSIFDLDPMKEKYDVVLMAGLLYHLEDPVRGLRIAGSVCRNILIVETAVSDLPGSVIEFDNHNENGYVNSSLPTVGAVESMTKRVGFRITERLKWCCNRWVFKLER